METAPLPSNTNSPPPPLFKSVSSDVPILLDYLVIGRGLAGTVFALRALARGRSVLVLDDHQRHCASVAAAGILNPVTGKHLVKSWNVEALLPAARAFYSNAERSLQTRFYFRHDILRLCQSEKEAAKWEKRKNDPAYAPFLGTRRPPGGAGPGVPDTLGTFEIREVGHVDCEAFLDATGRHLRSLGALADHTVDHAALRVDANRASLGPWNARHIVFSEGYRVSMNPWFKALPWQPAKGEILTLQIPIPPPREILNRSKWLLPLEDGTVKIGSTWDWVHLDETPTPRARTDLLSRMPTLLTLPQPAEVLRHQAGVRPCTRDARPFLGRHPAHPALVLFNGFGSKGALLSPWCAEHLLDHLETGAPLHPEADLARFTPFLQ